MAKLKRLTDLKKKLEIVQKIQEVPELLASLKEEGELVLWNIALTVIDELQNLNF